MKLLKKRQMAAVLLAAVAASACAGTSMPTPRTSVEPSKAQGSTPSGIAAARADSIRRPYTAADIHFMSAMIGHHSQAIVVARWAPTHGASPSVLRLAERIVNGQEDEISIMKQWLIDRRQPVPEPGATTMQMSMNGMTHDMAMPGMLTESQLRQLNAARSDEFDRLFLKLMIQHHRGAVSMVKDLFGSHGAGQDETIFKFASDVNVDQATEINRMEKMLASLVLGVTFP